MPEYRHTNISFLRDIPKIGDVFIIRKIKNTVPWTYVISDLNSELITRTFYKKELQKTSPEKFRIEKVLKGKVINCTSNGKDTTINLIVGLIKKTMYKDESILSQAV